LGWFCILTILLAPGSLTSTGREVAASAVCV
jgi:hypothetical protein